MRRVAGDGVELAVRDEGEGPAVLLLHGVPDTHRLWRLRRRRRARGALGLVAVEVVGVLAVEDGLLERAQVAGGAAAVQLRGAPSPVSATSPVTASSVRARCRRTAA